MAHQAFLAMQRRNLSRDTTGARNGRALYGSSSFSTNRRRSGVNGSLSAGEQIRDALLADKDRLDALFEVWDENGDGELSAKEFRRAIKMLGVKASKDEISQFLSLHDVDSTGTFSLEELTLVVKKLEETPKDRAKTTRRRLLRRMCWPAEEGLKSAFKLVSTTTTQTVLYLGFVATTTHFLTNALRIKEEYFLDKAMNDMFFNNVYDKDLNRFPNIRRVADIFDWGNQVLWPGLLGNGGPSCSLVGAPSLFASADPNPPPRDWSGVCNDDTYPDGEGALGRVGATAVTVADVVRRMNQMDWTAGVRIFQSRVAPRTPTECRTYTIGSECLPESQQDGRELSTLRFGVNWTVPAQPLSWPFLFHTAADMGTDPGGERSASIASFKTYPPDGFASFVLPFFSAVYLPEERGLGSSVTDFKLTRASRDNGKTPNFFCVRLSWDGTHVHQLCDPNDPITGATTGVVRAAIVEFWNDLKRAHYLDAATRLLALSIPMVSNNVGSQARVRIFFELTSSGTVLPSYDSQTRLMSPDSLDNLELYLWIGFGFCAFFCFLEVLEILGLEDGSFDLDDILNYVKDIWNITDWACYSIYFYAWAIGREYLAIARGGGCTSAICSGVGYEDDYLAFAAVRDLKLYLSLSICLQLLKVMKILAIMVPKMGLAPAVLKKALPDLVAFAGVFMISVLAFSSIFHLVLGSVMVEYNTKFASFISLSRALFGDFDINEVLENSPSYVNTVIYLAYLFVAVFILLSMFLAILGESQANLRDDQRDAQKAAGGEVPSDYGVLNTALKLITAGVEKLPLLGPQILNKKRWLEEEKLVKQAIAKQATPVDRIEARQLELHDKLDDAFAELRSGLQALEQRFDALSSPAVGSPFSAGTPLGAPKTVSTTTPVSPEVVVDELKRLESLIMSMGSATGTRRRRRVVKLEDSSPELVGLATKEPPPRQQGTRKRSSRSGSPTFLVAQPVGGRQHAADTMPLGAMEA